MDNQISAEIDVTLNHDAQVSLGKELEKSRIKLL